MHFIHFDLLWLPILHRYFMIFPVSHWAARHLHPAEFYLQCGDGCSHGSHEMGTHGSLFPATCPQQLRKSRRIVGLMMFDRLFGWGGYQPHKNALIYTGSGMHKCIWISIMNAHLDGGLAWWCSPGGAFNVMLKQHPLLVTSLSHPMPLQSKQAATRLVRIYPPNFQGKSVCKLWIPFIQPSTPCICGSAPLERFSANASLVICLIPQKTQQPETCPRQLEQNFLPNHISFGILLRSCRMAGKWQDAFQMLSQQRSLRSLITPVAFLDAVEAAEAVHLPISNSPRHLQQPFDFFWGISQSLPSQVGVYHSTTSNSASILMYKRLVVSSHIRKCASFKVYLASIRRRLPYYCDLVEATGFASSVAAADGASSTVATEDFGDARRRKLLSTGHFVV